MPLPTEPPEVLRARANEAIRRVNSIKAKLAAGAEFRDSKSSEFFTRMRDKLAKYKTDTFLTAGGVAWLVTIDEKKLRGGPQKKAAVLPPAPRTPAPYMCYRCQEGDHFDCGEPDCTCSH